ncbi:hypothetical protein QR680_014275 [Steinernema hermaphroditum]|uniref:Protein kinase domain-containing protein n=1 Tax=Steinernema hermaphroditum TaxID=289476 RepID=A0AA39M2X7_9BILA|nr:hypothetical protein QR680_014275 [Steinernema hermaphroditum]
MGKSKMGKHAGKHIDEDEPPNTKIGANKKSQKRKPKEEEAGNVGPEALSTGRMPSIRNGFAIKCKDGDPDNRYQLVVKKQITDRVYIAHNTKCNKDFCLKIEPFDAVNELKQLRRDLFIMCDAKEYPTTLGSHFFPVTNKGAVNGFFNYIVMPLGQGSVADIRKLTLKGVFCVETAVRLSLETFQAINDLHTLGYIHRAIGPTKFVIGPEGCRLYMVGLSLAKCVYKTSKSAPLHKYGDSRFQSCNWHKRRDQFYKDDVESWLYMALDFFSPKNLPWTIGMPDMQMLQLKEDFLRDKTSKSLPAMIKKIKKKLVEVKEAEKPDYRSFKEMLLELKKEVGCKMKGPYKWQLSKSLGPVGNKEKGVDSKTAVEQPDEKKEQYEGTILVEPDQKVNRKQKRTAKATIEESPFVNDDAPNINKKEKIKSKISKNKKRSKGKTKDSSDMQRVCDRMSFVTLEDMWSEARDTAKKHRKSRKPQKTSGRLGDSEETGERFDDEENDEEDYDNNEAPFEDTGSFYTNDH